MDQLKVGMAWCKKNIFWIGCFLLAATMIGSWVFSSMQLAEAQRKRESVIEKQVKALKKVSGTTAEADLGVKAHPNAATEAGMDAEIDRTINSIVRAWTKRYKEQQSILTWPEDVLGTETCAFFSRIDVPEKVTDLGKGFEKYRKAYYDKIPTFMNGICDDLDVNWQYNMKRNKEEALKKRQEEDEDGMGGYGGRKGGGMSGGGMGGGGMGFGNGDDTTFLDEINRYAVNWDETNQGLWYQKLTQFQGYDDHIDAVLYPTYMQANMLQQDLWLLEAMFKNIKKINNGSTSNDTSMVQTIDHIVFGREASSQLGQLSEVDGRLAGAAVGPAMGGGGGGLGGKAGGGPSPGGGYGAAMAQAYGGIGAPGGGGLAIGGEGSAYDRRYVNPELESISASDVRAVLGGAALPETNLELIVAKRVPFRLAVQMDERKINEFISICANSEFVFEINQVRINRHLDFPGAIAFNGGARAGSAVGGGGGDEDESRVANKMAGGLAGGFAGGSEGGAAAAPEEELTPTPVESRQDFIVAVEYYGVVKIYNPVRENFLRLAAGQNVVDETADPSMEAAAPAAQPAAAAAATAKTAAAALAQPEAITPQAAPGATQPVAAAPGAAAAVDKANTQPAGPTAPAALTPEQPAAAAPAAGAPVAAPAEQPPAQPALGNGEDTP